MSDNEKQIGVRVTETLWREFREDVKARKGRVNGHLASEVEAALREYMDASHGGDVNDRLTRIEKQLDDLGDRLGDSEPKKEDSGVGNRVESRLEEIIETVESEADGSPRVHDSVIEMAIETHAGVSDPTVRQYKNLLRKRKVAFADPRPNSNYHYLDAPRFCDAVNAMVEDGDISEDKYLEVLEGQHSREWWRDQLAKIEDNTEDRTPGFQ